MFRKKKKIPCSPNEILEGWEPAYKNEQEEELCLLSYDYHPEKDGYSKTEGILFSGGIGLIGGKRENCWSVCPWRAAKVCFCSGMALLCGWF